MGGIVTASPLQVYLDVIGLHGLVRRPRPHPPENEGSMVARKSDYKAEAVEAARSVLLELTRLLGEYQDLMVVVGGWVPELLIGKASRAHVGSIDVDIALDHHKLKDVGYKTILQLLLVAATDQVHNRLSFCVKFNWQSPSSRWRLISWQASILGKGFL